MDRTRETSWDKAPSFFKGCLCCNKEREKQVDSYDEQSQ